MKCHIYNKEPVGLAANMDSYFKQKPPDCSLFSQDSFEFQVYKELLFQTEYLREMIKSVNTGYFLSEALILKSIHQISWQIVQWVEYEFSTRKLYIYSAG